MLLHATKKSKGFLVSSSGYRKAGAECNYAGEGGMRVLVERSEIRSSCTCCDGLMFRPSRYCISKWTTLDVNFIHVKIYMYEQEAFVFCSILVAERQTIATFLEFSFKNAESESKQRI